MIKNKSILKSKKTENNAYGIDYETFYNTFIKGVKIKALADTGFAVLLAFNSIFEQLKNANVKYEHLSLNVKIQTLTNSLISFK